MVRSWIMLTENERFEFLNRKKLMEDLYSKATQEYLASGRDIRIFHDGIEYEVFFRAILHKKVID